MAPLHRLLLSAYLAGTWPYRRAAALLRAWRGASPVVVLFYHRIADDGLTPWTLSTDRFAAHIEWLAARFDLVSLEEAQRRIAAGRNDSAAVAITFDDGYADNLDAALPLLLRRGIPCTYFVTLANVCEGTPFPHDVHLSHPPRPNSLNELRDMADAGIEIGAHTRTHADLGAATSDDVLFDEVIAARKELSLLIGRPVRYFAFPFGQKRNLNRRAFSLAHDHGLAGVCSAYGGYNFPGDDAFHLRRIHADEEMVRLVNEVTIDPRKTLDTWDRHSNYGHDDRLKAYPAASQKL